MRSRAGWQASARHTAGALQAEIGARQGKHAVQRDDVKGCVPGVTADAANTETGTSCKITARLMSGWVVEMKKKRVTEYWGAQPVVWRQLPQSE